MRLQAADDDDDFAKSIGASKENDDDDFAAEIGAEPVSRAQELRKFVDEQDKKARAEQSSQLRSAGLGAVQGAAYNLADEAYGVAGAARDTFKGSPLEDYPARYRANRDSARDVFDQAEKDNPASYGTGQVGGGVASMFVPGANLAFLGKGAAAGAGAVTSFGASDKASTSDNVLDTIKGGVAGYGAGKLTEGASRMVGSGRERLAEMLQRRANEKAVKSSGAMTAEFRNLHNRGQLQNQGRYLLDKKIVTPLASLEDISERAGVHRKAAGERIGSIIDEADRLREQAIAYVQRDVGVGKNGAYLRKKINDEFGYNYNNVADQIEGLVSRDSQIAAAKFHRERLQQLADEFRSFGRSGGGTLRNGLRNKTEQRRLTKNVDNLADEYKQEVYDIISGELNRSVEGMERLRGGVEKLTAGKGAAQAQPASGPRQIGDGPQYLTDPIPSAPPDARKTIDDFRQANRDYAAAAVAQKTADNRLGNVMANRDYGLTTMGAGMVGMMQGGPPAAVAMGAANNFFRKYGSTMQATSLHRVAEALRQNPEAFGRYGSTLTNALGRGVQSFAVTNFLIGKSDPEYQTFLDKLMKGAE